MGEVAVAMVEAERAPRLSRSETEWSKRRRRGVSGACVKTSLPLSAEFWGACGDGAAKRTGESEAFTGGG